MNDPTLHNAPAEPSGPTGANQGETAAYAPLQPPGVALRPAAEEGDHAIVRPRSDVVGTFPSTHGRYQIFGEIARGGMGAILRAHDHELGRELAMKVLLEGHRDRPEVYQRFVEEAQIGGQLQHPGILPVYELGRFADLRPFFTMKLVKGKSLSELLRERPDASHDRPRFLRIFLQVCETVAYAHSRGVIHRDLKPSNVMVGAFGEVQVMDWGLAKVIAAGGIADERKAQQQRQDATVIRTVRTLGSHAPGSGSDTHCGSVLGTPAYMPPEQAAGEVERLDERCDVFGLGALLCELLTGGPPYEGSDPSVVHRKAVLGDLRDADARLDTCGADSELIRLARGCLNPDQAARPRNASIVVQELTDFLSKSEARLREAEIASARAAATAAEERKRRRVSMALAVTIAVASIGGAGLWMVMARQRAAHDLEAAEQRMHLSQQVHDALLEASQRREQAQAMSFDPGLLSQSQEAVRRAEALLSAASLETALLEQVKHAASELDRDLRLRDLIDRLETARLITGDNELQTEVRANRYLAYQQAFNLVGIGPTTLSPHEAAQRVRGFVPAVRDLLNVSLFDWANSATPDLGVQYLPQDGRVWITRLDPTGPAAAEGTLRAGDEIVDVAEEPGLSFGRYQGMPPDVIMGALKGGEGKRVRLKYRRKGSESEQVVELIRGQSRGWLMAAAADCVTNPVLIQVLGLIERAEVDKLKRTLQELDPSSQASASLCTLCGLLVTSQLPPEDRAAFCQRCQMAHPGDYWLNIWLCRFVKDSHPADGLRYAQAALALRPNSAPLCDWIGTMLHNQKRYVESEAYFRRALTLAPQSAHYRLSLAVVADLLGRPEEAVALLQEVNSLAEITKAHGQLGRLLAKLGRRQEALPELRTAVAQSIDYPAAYVNLGVVLGQEGQYPEAIAVLHRAIEFHPTDPATHYNLGAVYHRNGQLAQAQNEFLRGLQMAPHFATALTSRDGDRDYLPSLLTDDTRALIAQLHEQSQSIVTLTKEAQLLRGLGRPQAVVGKLREALATNFANAETMWALGDALALSGDRRGAVEQYSAAVEQDVHDLAHHTHLVRYCAWTRNVDDLRQHRSALLAQFGDSQDPIVLERVAKNCLLLADEHEALLHAAEMADRSVAISAESHWARAYLLFCRALGEYRTARFRESKASLRLALSSQNSNRNLHVPAMLLLAMAEQQSNQKDLARSHLLEAMTSYCTGSAIHSDEDYLIMDLLACEAAQVVLGSGGEADSTIDPLELVALAIKARHEEKMDEAVALSARAVSCASADSAVYPLIAFYSAEVAGLAAVRSEGTSADESARLAQTWLTAFLEARERSLPVDRGGELLAIVTFRNSQAASVFRDEEALSRQPVEQRAIGELLWRRLQKYQDGLTQ